MSDKVRVNADCVLYKKPRPGLVEAQCPGCGTYYYASETSARRLFWCSPACKDTVQSRARARTRERNKKRRQRGGLVPPALAEDLKARNLTFGEHAFIERQTSLVLRDRSLTHARDVLQAQHAQKRAEDDASFFARLNDGTLTAADIGNMTDKKALALANALPFTPREAERLRQRVATHIGTHLDTAGEVLGGTKTWSAQQVNVFKTLLNKVMPDVSFSHHLHETVRKPLRELTRDQLERIAAGELEADITDVTYSEVPDDHQSPEGRSDDGHEPG